MSVKIYLLFISFWPKSIIGESIYDNCQRHSRFAANPKIKNNVSQCLNSKRHCPIASTDDFKSEISGIGVKLVGSSPEATWLSNKPSPWGATSASFEVSSYLHVCQPTICKVTGHRPPRKVTSLNPITVVQGIGKPKYTL